MAKGSDQGIITVMRILEKPEAVLMEKASGFCCALCEDIGKSSCFIIRMLHRPEALPADRCGEPQEESAPGYHWSGCGGWMY